MQITRLTEVEAYNYCTETVNLKQELELKYMSMAKRLYTIKKDRLYEGQFGTWDLFLDEAKIHKSKAEQLARIYERYIVEHKLKPEEVIQAGGWTTAVSLLPVAKTPELARNALYQASLLPLRQNVREWVKEALADDFKACTHTETYTLEICKTCGERHKIAETN